MRDQLRVRGLNHLTLAVADLNRSITFYRDVLGCELRATWNEGAYLEAGSLWICLSVEPKPITLREDYTHYAFDTNEEEFEALSGRIRNHARIWKENRSEGASLYFRDPDGHRLELHVGSLASRIEHYRNHPETGVTIVRA
jgi:catechol 2,3-dioxygenase-like lactoylglutathione lyase family enzyme